MKYLQDEYKRVKDHNSRSGNNREIFDYFDEIDAVLGCKPNIAPKRVFECGFSEDASSSSVETGDSADPPQSSGQEDQSSDVKILKRTCREIQNLPKKRTKAKRLSQQRKGRPCRLRRLNQILWIS